MNKFKLLFFGITLSIFIISCNNTNSSETNAITNEINSTSTNESTETVDNTTKVDSESITIDDFIANYSKLIVKNPSYTEFNLISYSIIATSPEGLLLNKNIKGTELCNETLEKIKTAKVGTAIIFNEIIIENNGDTITAPARIYTLK